MNFSLKKLTLGLLVATIGLGPVPAQAMNFGKAVEQTKQHLGKHYSTYALIAFHLGLLQAYRTFYTTPKALTKTVGHSCRGQFLSYLFNGKGNISLKTNMNVTEYTNRFNKPDVTNAGHWLWLSLCFKHPVFIPWVFLDLLHLHPIPSMFFAELPAELCPKLINLLPSSMKKIILWILPLVPHLWELVPLWLKLKEKQKDNFVIVNKADFLDYISDESLKTYSKKDPEAVVGYIILPQHNSLPLEAYETLTQLTKNSETCGKKTLEKVKELIENTLKNEIDEKNIQNNIKTNFCYITTCVAKVNNLALFQQLVKEILKLFPLTYLPLKKCEQLFSENNNQKAVQWCKNLKKYINNEPFSESEDKKLFDLACLFDNENLYSQLKKLTKLDLILFLKPTIAYSNYFSNNAYPNNIELDLLKEYKLMNTCLALHVNELAKEREQIEGQEENYYVGARFGKIANSVLKNYAQQQRNMGLFMIYANKQYGCQIPQDLRHNVTQLSEL